MVFHGADPTTLLAVVTLGMALATSLLAGFTYLTIRAIRRQTSMAYWMGQLQNLYTPLHAEILHFGEDLGDWYDVGPGGGLHEEPPHNPWHDQIQPLMSRYGHLATDELHEIYEEITRLGPIYEPDDQPKQEEFLRRFKETAEADYRAIRVNLRKTARSDP